MMTIYEANSIYLPFFAFILGGLGYGSMEILFRGFTHWSMCITGGACILTFYFLYSYLNSISLISAAFLGATIITIYEFFVGIIVNLWFQWNVWDYSLLPGNVLGQICPQFFLIWVGLCFIFFGAIKIINF
ncbi:MAG: hypothetical protein PHH48_02145 [Eubacteriales bacterium]|nr:hypothetical protein [Eubacteriales bacterium]